MPTDIFLMLQVSISEAWSYYIIPTKLPSAKNGVAAVRQEAFRADRHFSNAPNDPFGAIVPHTREASQVCLSAKNKREFRGSFLLPLYF